MATRYYHGTRTRIARIIVQKGFKLGSVNAGRYYGNGLYLSKNMNYAAIYGRCVIAVELVGSLRILKQRKANRNVVSYLKREFGAKVATCTYWKALPKNKQLTKIEAINLWHFLCENREKSRRFDDLNFSRLFQMIRNFGYDGVEISDPVPETVLFNPSAARAIEVFKITKWSHDYEDEDYLEFEPAGF